MLINNQIVLKNDVQSDKLSITIMSIVLNEIRNKLMILIKSFRKEIKNDIEKLRIYQETTFLENKDILTEDRTKFQKKCKKIKKHKYIIQKIAKNKLELIRIRNKLSQTTESFNNIMNTLNHQ